MNRIAKWLVEQGFSFRTVIMCDGKKGFMVSTDYEGYYPTQEALEQQRLIHDKVKRQKGIRAESRGCDSAVLILEVAD